MNSLISIRIDGVDIRQIVQDKRNDCLTSEIFQSVDLLDDTIYNNIKVGSPHASKQEIIMAADKAQVLDFAWELPGGMHTRVGKGGIKLSNGKKLCIRIAQALLSHASIVLLEEVVDNLSAEDERYIQQAIQELVKLKAVVVMAYPWGTI